MEDHCGHFSCGKVCQVPKEEREFFLVWSPQGVTPPKKRHQGYTEAQNAAREMAALNRGKHFYVLKAVSVSICDQVQTKKLK